MHPKYILKYTSSQMNMINNQVMIAGLRRANAMRGNGNSSYLLSPGFQFL